jgi:prepilin-type processing-associated H-X9-DG protein
VISSEDAFTVFASANTMLLPYFEQANLGNLYDPRKSFAEQSPEVARTVVPVFNCPSNSKENPFSVPQLAAWGMPIGTTYGAIDYVYCKGPNDAWCLPWSAIPMHERGMFYTNWSCRMGEISDGSSNTFALGEGAGGPRWPLCHGAGCTTPYAGPSGPIPATNPWIIGAIGTQMTLSLGFVTGGIWGSTVEPPNKRPVTDTYGSITDVFNCTCSLNGGPHTTANFRSDHPGGVQFLLADGSVQFIGQAIDITVYRGLSTIAEGVPVTMP